MKYIKILLVLLLPAISTFWGCKGEEIISTITTPKSDLTRTGKFVSFTSNKDISQDIWLAQVDANGNLVTTGLVYPDNPHNLTASNIGTDKQSNWSPDGRILVYSSNEAIWAFFFKSDGSIDSGITPNPNQLFLLIGSSDENPQFSPDGKYLVWDRRNAVGLDTLRDLYRGTLQYDSSNGHIKVTGVITPTNLTNTLDKDEYDPKWSPRISVQRIAYTNHTSVTSNDWEVWIMDPLNPATNSVFYNPNRNGYPAWSPACDRIYFESDHGSNYLYIAWLSYPTFSGNPNTLVQSNTLNLRYPTRMPNANYIAYIRVGEISPGNGSIFVTSTVTGGDGHKLLPTGFDNADSKWPAW